MKVRSISKMLIAIILSSNFNINSYANTSVIDSERYELFEGRKSLVQNVIDSDEVEVEIEGNTLVNRFKCESINDFNSLTSGSTVTSDGYININTDGSKFMNFFPKKNSMLVNPDTTYTFVVEIATNTLVKTDPNSTFAFIFGESYPATNTTVWQNGKSFSKDTPPGIYSFTLKTKSDLSNATLGDRGFVNMGYSGELKFRYMVIEGNHIGINPNYFKGIESVGYSDTDEHEFNLISRFNNNMCDDIFINETGQGEGANGMVYPNMFIPAVHRVRTKNLIKVNGGETYHLGSNGRFHLAIGEFDKNNIQIKDSGWILDTNGGTYTVSSNCENIIIVIRKSDNTNINKEDVIGNVWMTSTNTVSQSDSKNVKLKEPLRALPNGVKDRIIKKDGQWVVERNIETKQLTGDEFIRIDNNNPVSGVTKFTIDSSIAKDVSLVCDSILGGATSPYTIRLGGGSSDNPRYGVYLNLPDTYTVEQAREYLRNKKPVIQYQKFEATYEPIKESLIVKLFEGSTEISTSSNVPANIIFKVDRALNKALDAINTAKTTPTIENISIARMWTNLAKESIKKDAFQIELNNIVDITDLSLEKKKATANLDLYIRSENTLSMSLDTNSVTFDGYNGLEEMEKFKAVNISISSSLPYDLNAYIPEHITNADNSNSMSINLVNIKESSESIYKTFANITDKIVLKADCEAGNNKVHGIDLKLDTDNTHRADVYKTTIMFEAQQK